VGGGGGRSSRTRKGLRTSCPAPNTKQERRLSTEIVAIRAEEKNHLGPAKEPWREGAGQNHTLRQIQERETYQEFYFGKKKPDDIPGEAAYWRGPLKLEKEGKSPHLDAHSQRGEKALLKRPSKRAGPNREASSPKKESLSASKGRTLKKGEKKKMSKRLVNGAKSNQV